jgi:hypothetical protein
LGPDRQKFDERDGLIEAVVVKEEGVTTRSEKMQRIIRKPKKKLICRSGMHHTSPTVE